MMRRIRALTTSSLLSVLGLLACEGTNPTVPSAANQTKAITGQTGLGLEISTLIASGFSKGQATAIAAKWDQVLRAIAKEPKTTLKGKSVPGSGGRAELVRTVDFIRAKTGNATPPAGESPDHFVARLVLDMSLYVYGGASTPVPVVDPGSDVAFKTVQPGTTDTVVTPAKLAAVVFAPGSVAEPTVVVITPDATYYPANCSGPLDTHLCQYPKFYHFNVFPDVKLGVSAKVQLCHVDAGVNRRALADHARFRFAHDRPADEANYTSGSTIVDNIEILPLTPMAVTNCEAGDGTTYVPPISANLTPLGSATSLAMGILHRATSIARRLLVPEDVYAIDVGLGGLVDDFSMFGIVDPVGIADLAQATPQFSLASTSLITGGAANVGAWAVRNVGSATSAAFTSSVIVATDSLLTAPVATFAAGGAAALVPGSNFNYSAMSITVPTALESGTYFIGTKVLPTGADSSVSDNLVSVRVVVSSPVPQSVGAASWTGIGPGTVTATVNNPNLVTLGYAFNYSPNQTQVNIDGHSVFPWQTWTYSTNAVSSGIYTFAWTYTGDHNYFDAYATLEAFASGPSGEMVVPLVPYVSYQATSEGSYGNVQGPFSSFRGSATLTLTAGYAWGVRPAGYNYDYNRSLTGTVTLTDPVFTP